MSKQINPKWQAGWLQLGLNCNGITKEAQQELDDLKKKHPDWDFDNLAKMVDERKLDPWIDSSTK